MFQTVNVFQVFTTGRQHSSRCFHYPNTFYTLTVGVRARVCLWSPRFAFIYCNAYTGITIVHYFARRTLTVHGLNRVARCRSRKYTSVCPVRFVRSVFEMTKPNFERNDKNHDNRTFNTKPGSLDTVSCYF